MWRLDYHYFRANSDSWTNAKEGHRTEREGEDQRGEREGKEAERSESKSKLEREPEIDFGSGSSK